MRRAGLVRGADTALAPPFIPYTPWTTPAGCLDLLRDISALGLVRNVAPVQLAIRLLVPSGSRLLEAAELQRHLDGFDADALSYRWTSSDPAADALYADVRRAVEDGEAGGAGRDGIFAAIWRRAHAACGLAPPPLPETGPGDHPDAPLFSEAWYCCAEPTGQQFARV